MQRAPASAIRERRSRIPLRFMRATRIWGLDHHHLGADPDAVVEVDDVLVAHADAAGGDRGADGPRFVRAMNAVERGAEIHRPGAERIFRAALHVARQVRAALEHLFGRNPVRPFALGRNVLDARPREARAADADAVADRAAPLLDEVEKTLARIDDDGAGFLRTRIFDDLAAITRVHGGTPGHFR